MLSIRLRRAESVRLSLFFALANILGSSSSEGASSRAAGRDSSFSALAAIILGASLSTVVSSRAAGIASGMLKLNSAGTMNLVGMLMLASASKIGADMDMLPVRIRARWWALSPCLRWFETAPRSLAPLLSATLFNPSSSCGSWWRTTTRSAPSALAETITQETIMNRADFMMAIIQQRGWAEVGNCGLWEWNGSKFHRGSWGGFKTLLPSKFSPDQTRKSICFLIREESRIMCLPPKKNIHIVLLC